MFARVAFVLIASWLLGACAIGNTYDYRAQAPAIEVTTDKSLAVAVVDQRAYVLSGDKAPKFIGLQRGGFGNPFDVTTQSGDPLASDMSQAMVQSLAARDVAARAVLVAPTANVAGARAQALAANPSRALLVYLREWKTDTMINVALIYNIEAEVLDAQGKKLGGASSSGNENLGGDAVNPPGYAGIHVPKAFARVFGQLLSNPDIANALQ